MATIKKVYSDNGRSHVLRTTANTAQNDAAKGEAYLSTETLNSVIAFIPNWEQKLLQVNQYLSQREKEIREKNVALDFLDTVVRDVWEVEKRRVKRLALPAEVLTYYQLPLSGLIPKMSKEQDLFAIASKILTGDAEAVIAGYDTISNPSVSEVLQALDAAIKEKSDIAPADRAYDKAEEEVLNLRPQADELISDIVDELKFNLRKRDGASQRRIIRSYGIEISYTTGNIPSDENELIE